jgi:putative peptide zinc metalloprotease protein
MTEPLFSPSWYRVASLRPRLRGHARIHRHHYRNELWYVLQDQSAGKYHRFSPAAYYLIGLMDGERTVQQLWEQAGVHLGDDLPTQDEAIRLLGQLHAADVLQCDVPPDLLELFRRHQQHRKTQWKQRLRSPLVIRVPLWDPERFLERWLPLVRPLFSWYGAMLWLVVVVTALVLAGIHWSELTESVADRVLAPQNLLLLWLAYPLVKALHELGHGFATKVWGGEVHEMGIMFLVFMPVPYVDASAASAFRDRRKRMLVGAAGILVELFLASIALFVWLNVEPGVVRAIAYNVMLIGGVSTVLFNGNPLLRFDGYYVLADAIEIPNLGTRANRYFGYLFQRYLFGLKKAVSPVSARGERFWFITYGIAAFLYRILIMAAIILFVAGKFFVVGVLLALWAVVPLLLMPAWKAMSFLLFNPQLNRRRARSIAISAMLVCVLAGILFLVPVPMRTQAEGVVWLPEQSIVRAGTDGFVTGLQVEPDALVSEGTPLIVTQDPFLTAELRILESRHDELSLEYKVVRNDDRVRARILKEELKALEEDLARHRERIDRLVIRSPTTGRFVLPQAADLPDRFLRQGQLVGYVLDDGAPTARVVVSQQDVSLVRQHTREVELRLAGRPDAALPATIQREVPGASNRLPAVALGSQGGGAIAIDPRDGQGVTTFERVFQFDVSIAALQASEYIGGRVLVQFDHGFEPLGLQGYRAIRQLLLRRFNV